MKIVVVDGQGGGLGRLLVSMLKQALPGQAIIAVGANAMATSAMLRAGADAGATGENAVCYNCRDADILLGPSGIAIANAMLGEISPAMADAVQQSPARRFLLPMDQCGPLPRDSHRATMQSAARALVDAALACIPPQP